MAYRKYTGSYFRAFVVLVDVVVEKILQKYQVMICIHLYLHLGVSKNRVTPKSSIFVRFSIFFPSILGYPYFRKPPFSCRLNMLRIFWLGRIASREGNASSNGALFQGLGAVCAHGWTNLCNSKWVNIGFCKWHGKRVGNPKINRFGLTLLT